MLKSQLDTTDLVDNIVHNVKNFSIMSLKGFETF